MGRRLGVFMNAWWLVAIAVLVGAGRVGGAVSDPAVVEVTGGLIRLNIDYNVGWAFRANVGITVTDLGVYDENGNGVLDESQAPTVGLWDIDETLYASAVVPLDTAPEDGFFYTPIPPITLPPGEYVLGVVNFEGGEEYRRDSVVQIDPRIEWIEGRYVAGGNLAYPYEIRTTPSAYFGPSFKLFSAPLIVTTPVPRAVYQRGPGNYADIVVSGAYGTDIDAVEIEAVPVPGYAGTAAGRQVLDPDPAGGVFEGFLRLRGGWYQITIIAVAGGEDTGAAMIDRVGVGEVFVTAGQSNAANHGAPAQSPADDRVSCYDTGFFWRHAADPQPIATGTGGSPWPAFGDALAGALDVPVGLVSVGYSGASVGQWVPGRELYPRLRQAVTSLGVNGFRAVLWHQGESDSINGTSIGDYAQRLEAVIAESRADAGFRIPWGVAIASWIGSSTSANQAKVRAGQWQVINADPDVFLGSETDSFHTLGYLSDHVHFNTTGLTLHGLQWAERVRKHFFPRPASPGRVTSFVRVGPDEYRIEWDAETGVTYEVQGASGVTGVPVTWSGVGAWVVGPQNWAVIQVAPGEMHGAYRVVAPHTEE